MMKRDRQAEEAFVHDPSATAAFAVLKDLSGSILPKRRFKAVVIGGGTGAPVSIRTLLSMGVKTSAVVAMADDGGSTGILRTEAGATAPGDIRKCLTAMASDSDDPFTEAFKIRFTFAENHTLGNLVLSALEATTGSFPEAIAICEKMLGARGHVYPSTLGRVILEADTADGRTVFGQAVASHSRSPLSRVRLSSEEPIAAYEPAVHAIERADLIVLGPGSLFTSIIPNLLVPGIVEAISRSSAPVAFVCSLADVQGETRGMSVTDHVRALEEHGMTGLVDFLIANAPSEADERGDAVRPVLLSSAEAARIEARGIQVIMRDLADHNAVTWHDPLRLREAFEEVLGRCRSPRM